MDQAKGLSSPSSCTLIAAPPNASGSTQNNKIHTFILLSLNESYTQGSVYWITALVEQLSK